MSATFITAGPYSWGSSRMRAYWPAQYIQGARCIQLRDIIEHNPIELAALENSPIIWQKQVTMSALRDARRADVAQWWDICDPAWWWNPRECREVSDTVQGVVLSSAALRDDFVAWYGSAHHAYVIKDRLELSHFPIKRLHEWHHPIRLIWYGVGVNRVSLFAALANLERLAANGHQIELTICDDRPEETFSVSKAFPIYHTRWDVETENAIIAAHDVALLPPYPGAWGSVKSNNKQVTAAACGVPFVSGVDYLELCKIVADTELRRTSADVGLKWAVDEYDVTISAREWEALLCAA